MGAMQGVCEEAGKTARVGRKGLLPWHRAGQLSEALALSKASG